MPNRVRALVVAWALTLGAGCGAASSPPGSTPPSGSAERLPPAAAEQLQQSLAAAARHRQHVWRDIEPFNPDATLNGYIEIARGERTKWEFDMRANARVIDRMLDESVGTYPVNYGYVPQTISFDGDPFDVLVLGPPIEGGQLVRGIIVGILYMDDEKGRDMKVVMAPPGARDAELNPELRARIAAWFDSYKKPERSQGKWSKVHGWGDAVEARRMVEVTHRFFEEGRARRP